MEELETMAMQEFIAEHRSKAITRPAHLASAPLDRVELPSAILGLVPGELAWRHRLIPTRRRELKLEVTMLIPSDAASRAAVAQAAGMEVEAIEGADHAIRLALARYYPGSDEPEDYWCTFCRQRRSEAAPLATTAYAGICTDCLRLAETGGLVGFGGASR